MTLMLDEPETVPAQVPGPTRPPLRERLYPPMPDDRWWGWLGPLVVTVFAGILRFWHLGLPHAFVFDETYYAKDADSLVHYGFEQSTVANADKLVLAGHTNVFTGDGSYIVHPPLGKWIIAIGIKAFGMDPFGWRFMVAVLGTLSVLILARTVRRMMRSTSLGVVAGFLLAIDGLHLVMSRTALLDLILMFWVLLAFAALVLDRDHARRRLAERADDFRGSRLGRGQGIRWLRVAAGFCLGCACATKWSGLWFLVAFGLLTVAWDAGARRAVGVRWPTTGAFARDATPAFASIVPIALVTYVASWAGWFHSKNAWDRQWATGKASDWSWIPAPLRSLWHYHTEMYSFHTHLTTPHSYQSNPWGWLILARPVSFFYQGTKNGDPGCHVASCSQEVLALGTPLIWWAAFLSLFVCLWLVLAKKDWRANAALIGIAAGWLPWIHYSERTIFQFYSVAFVPFLVIALTLVLGLILGPANATARRRTIGSVLVGAYLLLAFADFVSLWPLYTGQVLPYDDWYRRLLHIRAWI